MLRSLMWSCRWAMLRLFRSVLMLKYSPYIHNVCCEFRQLSLELQRLIHAFRGRLVCPWEATGQLVLLILVQLNCALEIQLGGTRNCLTVYLNKSFYCSVWSSLPPVKASSSSEKKVVLAITSMDSASFFRDKTLGADSPLSVSISSSGISVQFLYSISLQAHFEFSYATGITDIIGSCGCSLKSF